ncbi:MAG: hypothetical protein WKF84_08500 [Pyrinomonadaceae bacterium]
MIGEQGQMEVVGKARLFVTFDDAGRAHLFRNKNRSGAEIISFEIDPFFVRKVQKAAVSQAEGREFPNAPQIADQLKHQVRMAYPKNGLIN